MDEHSDNAADRERYETPGRLLPKLDLNITNRCNYRCHHCAFASGEKPYEEMPLDTLRAILLETKTLGGKRIDITGGEPTLRPDFRDILRVAKDFEYNVELVTNGSTLNGQTLMILKQDGLDAIAVSVDGSSYERYHRIRPVPERQYRHVLQTIEDAVELGIRTKINSIACEETLDDLPMITRYAIECDAEEHGIYYFTPVGRGEYGGLRTVNPLRWLDFVRSDLVPFSGKITMSIEAPLLEKELVTRLDKPLGCIASVGQQHLQILPDGKTYPCAILASYGIALGDLSKQDISSIWRNENVWKEYRNSISTVFSSGQCFSMPEYDAAKYVPICPLRKLSLEDLRIRDAEETA